MGLIDRGVRRALHGLASDEMVVASLCGHEADGRRRRFVLVTDRRILVGSARGDAPLDLPLPGTSAGFDRAGRLLSLRRDAEEVVLRDVDELAARAVVEVVMRYRRPSPQAAPTSVAGVRVVDRPDRTAAGGA